MSQEIEITPLQKARRPVKFVDSKSQLDIAVADLATSNGRIAIDAERASGFKYSQRAYLIQIARATGNIYLIDPAKIVDENSKEAFAPLASLLADSEWILHAATQDLPCLADLGLHPLSIFDTELGSRIAGLPRVGLGAVVEHFLQLGLAKEHSAVDWSKRPLEQSWLDYAALDVDVLHELADALEADLRLKEKIDYAQQEFRHLLNFRPKPENPDKWRGLTGLHEVKSEVGLAIARAMWQAREQLAQKLDVAPGRLIPDASISHIAKTKPKSKPELASDKHFAGRASRTYLDTWWKAIEDGSNSRDLPALKVAHAGIPNHRSWPTRWPNAHKRLSLVRSALTELANSLEIPLENVLSPETIRQICWPERDVVDSHDLIEELRTWKARPWQIELVAAIIQTEIANASKLEQAEAVVED